MKNKLIGLFIALVLVGCVANEDPNQDPTAQQTTVTSRTEVVQPNNKYSSILFHPDEYDESTYREPDFFTSFTDRMQGGSDLPPIPFDRFIESDVDVIARVKIIENHGGFDVNQRWPREDFSITTVWTKNVAEVVDVYFGEEQIGNAIEVLQLGGIYEDMLHDYTSYFEELEVGSEYLILAMDIVNHPSSLMTEPNSKLNTYFIVSPFDGYYKIIDERIIISKHVAHSAHFKSNSDVSAVTPYLTEQMSYVQRFRK